MDGEEECEKKASAARLGLDWIEFVFGDLEAGTRKAHEWRHRSSTGLGAVQVPSAGAGGGAVRGRPSAADRATAAPKTSIPGPGRTSPGTEAQSCLDAPPSAAARRTQRLSEAADVSVAPYAATGARLDASMAVMPEETQETGRHVCCSDQQNRAAIENRASRQTQNPIISEDDPMGQAARKALRGTTHSPCFPFRVSPGHGLLQPLDAAAS
ncbi:hypothetical protein MRS44_003130 [Fusarium solani]|uniref:uncharacterized protein n=1 Tax=Fusarium solani TaxID=169388 RepID=UPI0032C43182|nr:hypothetical protein MRS44_003130 [Fusarium solani]